jgi:hypothetical protein
MKSTFLLLELKVGVGEIFQKIVLLIAGRTGKEKDEESKTGSYVSVGGGIGDRDYLRMRGSFFLRDQRAHGTGH